MKPDKTIDEILDEEMAGKTVRLVSAGSTEVQVVTVVKVIPYN